MKRIITIWKKSIGYDSMSYKQKIYITTIGFLGSASFIACLVNEAIGIISSIVFLYLLNDSKDKINIDE